MQMQLSCGGKMLTNLLLLSLMVEIQEMVSVISFSPPKMGVLPTTRFRGEIANKPTICSGYNLTAKKWRKLYDTNRFGNQLDLNPVAIPIRIDNQHVNWLDRII